MKKITPILLFVFASSSVIAQVSGHSDKSLILYLSFDALDGRTVKDHSEYKNNGKLVGYPTLVEGKFGKALKFNGRNNWVEIPHHESLTVDTSVTVMAWIKTSRHGGPNGASRQCIVAKGDDPRSYSLYTEKRNGTLLLSISDRTKKRNGTLLLSISDRHGSNSLQNIVLNRWQHVAAQVDNGIHRYWINGKVTAVFQIDVSLPGQVDTASVRVGNSHDTAPPNSPDRHFLGLIDELRVWNRALSHDEIIKEMNTGNKSAQYPDEPSKTQQSSEEK